ncbi:unnamed protein product [Linum trigynum]|uniref:Uncharacterized protein n=1 Tax=Linum trigynum TaxID=586398 RepID=A0AAV2CVI0_9ROSI
MEELQQQHPSKASSPKEASSTTTTATTTTTTAVNSSDSNSSTLTTEEPNAPPQQKNIEEQQQQQQQQPAKDVAEKETNQAQPQQQKQGEEKVNAANSPSKQVKEQQEPPLQLIIKLNTKKIVLTEKSCGGGGRSAVFVCYRWEEGVLCRVFVCYRWEEGFCAESSLAIDGKKVFVCNRRRDARSRRPLLAAFTIVVGIRNPNRRLHCRLLLVVTHCSTSSLVVTHCSPSSLVVTHCSPSSLSPSSLLARCVERIEGRKRGFGATIARSSRLEGPFEVSPDGIVKFKEKDGIDYAVLTVQLPGSGRVPFLFTVKQLVASGKPESFSCEFLVPRGDEEELAKENVKNAAASKGKITLSVTKSKSETGEVIGDFLEHSAVGHRFGCLKDVRIQGVWYAQLD